MNNSEFRPFQVGHLRIATLSATVDIYKLLEALLDASNFVFR